MLVLEAETMAFSKATQTEDDWDEVKADVKQLVNALRSLDLQSKQVESERKFGTGVSSPNVATQARKVGDEEVGPHEPKHRFPYFLRTGKSGESSDPKDKGKTPEKSP
ncbi:hypothetical protein FHL15_007603 [Xylaria flabelliformis]|uniref:Uncharacterized protein n=1 Tax=Xylaria flabelliformis TaxID=2512241 RepID=A0A553HUH4_9PEZI|nr:hypothetical protein FHL15_007603 [Xylaria flabelliformis]